MMPLYRLFHVSSPPRSRAADDPLVEARLDAMAGDIAAAVDLGAYAEVAHVEARDCEEAYRLTNHIEADWTHGPAIKRLAGQDGTRSTSIGDILMDEEGRLHRVAFVGFEELPSDMAARFHEKLTAEIPTMDGEEFPSP